MKARAERAGPNLRFPSREIYRPIDWPNHRPHETFGQADSACRAGTLAQTHFGLESEGSQPDDDVQTNNEHRPAWHLSIPPRCRLKSQYHAARPRCQYPQKSTLGLLRIASATMRSIWLPFGSRR